MKRCVFLGMAGGASCFSAGPKWLLGSNTAVRGYGLYEAIGLVQRLKFPVIEIHPMGRPEPTPEVFPGFRFDKLAEAERKKLRNVLRWFRRVTAHLPYIGLNWLSRDQGEREKAVRTIDVALDGAAYCGVNLAVLHPQPLTAEPWKQREGEYVAAVRRWGDRGEKLGVGIAMETGFPQSVADCVGLVNAVNHRNVGVTIDVGHQGRFTDLSTRIQPEDRARPDSIKAYNDTTLKIIEQLGRKVFHLHVHDIDPETWVEHKPMVPGFVDYPRLFAKLRETDYTGALVLEIGGEPGKMPEYLRAAREKFIAWLD